METRQKTKVERKRWTAQHSEAISTFFKIGFLRTIFLCESAKFDKQTWSKQAIDFKMANFDGIALREEAKNRIGNVINIA